MKFLILFMICSFYAGPIFTKENGENIEANPLKSEDFDLRLIGVIDETQSSDFLQVPMDSILHPNKPGIYLLKDTYIALERVAQDFQKHFPKIPFSLLSGTRNFGYQKQIWERKWNLYEKENHNNKEIRNKILKYSSMPATSRHHWGTDVDIFFINSSDFQTPIGKKIYRWMVSHLPKYGFQQCFSKGRAGGYSVEEWHWSYMPLAQKYVDGYRKLLQNPQVLLHYLRTIKGLSEKEITDRELLSLVKEYVFDVHSTCL